MIVASLYPCLSFSVIQILTRKAVWLEIGLGYKVL